MTLRNAKLSLYSASDTRVDISEDGQHCYLGKEVVQLLMIDSGIGINRDITKFNKMSN